MGLVFIPLYIDYLGIEAYGLIGLFAVLQAWLGLLDVGITPTLAREMARFNGGGHSAQSIRDILRSMELIAVAVAILVAGSVAISASWIASSWLNTETMSRTVVAHALTIMGFVTALRFIEGLYRSAILGLQRQVLFNAVSSAMATLRGLGAVGILAWVSPSIEAFFIWQGLVSIATLIIFIATTYANLPRSESSGRFSMEAMSGVWRFASGVFLINLLNMMTQVDKILLSKILPLNEYGAYMVAVNIAFTLFIFIAPIQQAYYPRYCELYAREDTCALIENYHKGAQLVTVIAGSAAIVLAFYSESILKLWMGDSELSQNVAHLVSILVLGYLLLGSLVIPKDLMLAHGWTSLSVKLYIVFVPIIVLLILLFVPKYGAEAAAYVQIILGITLLAAMIHFLHDKLLKLEKLRWYKEDVLFPLASASISVYLLKLVWYEPISTFDLVVELVIASVIAVAVSTLAAGRVRNYVFLIIARLRNNNI